MEGSDNNGDGRGASALGWTWKPTARTWVLIVSFIIGLVPVALKACGVKPTRKEYPPVNTGYDPNNESQKRSANDIKQLSNLANQMRSMQQNANSNQTNSKGKTAPKR